MRARSGWWRRELLCLSILAMDATWLTLWVGALAFSAGDGRQGLPFLGVLTLLLAVFAFTRLFVASRLPLGAQQTLVGALAVALALALTGLRVYGHYPFLEGTWVVAWLRDLWRLQQGGVAGAVLLGLTLYAAGRSISLVQGRLETSSAGFHFRFGILAWFWHGALGLFGWAEGPVSYLFLFFLCGLLAVGLSRVEEVHNGRGAVRSPFTGSWVLILAGSALATVGLGVAATRALSEGVVRVAWRALGPARAALAWIVYVLADVMLRLLMPLLKALGGALGATPEQIANAEAKVPTVAAPGTQPTGLPLPIQALVWVFILLIVAGVVFLVVTGLRQREGDRRSWVGRETVWASVEGAAGHGLGAQLQRLRERLTDALGTGPRPAYRLASVREIYASLQRLGARHGLGREEPETPYEYRRRLHSAWPEAGSAVSSITEAYVRAHYGERAFSPGEIEALRASWARVQDLVERGEEEHKG